ncbi:hypothetical protein A7H1H_0298 [Aliarcobacter butzleri 7h1h]|jgi:hypothetical protein|uniref:Stringent starvation protein B n=1 Tax=Aliarcobacter butzleri L352 TaxID=1447260 RepID=A0A837JCP0_9BACT|nr:hypothetical protein [Aliarcobacter butzleri]AGR76623.1 hypothetical protein A7H1H_0298 [Aliarcobacter butzleri 7h1h]KLE06192.1 hypothetical protein AF77_02555 [Aliarcobacter butzleri L352]MBF7069959.1 hypothetical protein [Aliarcobacter butzleri]MCG3709243.1 hypothetical protein [Aliarcobacter butzleri]MCT7589938.1 hypothetical protein [Aliarcobacter butzleri]
MIKDIIENPNYKELIEKQIQDIIVFLLDNNQEFSITANITPISFNPALPEEIKSQLHKFSLFVLSNYTYTTIEINEEFLSFEAGFGNENFGSVVKIPLHAIFQIIVDDSILYLNSIATVEKFNRDLEKNSFNIFKNNPNNKRFN